MSKTHIAVAMPTQQFAQHQPDRGLLSGAEWQQLSSEAHICVSVGTEQPTSKHSLCVRQTLQFEPHTFWLETEMNFTSVQ